MESTARHPHSLHILLVLVLLAIELFVFKGQGMLTVLGKLGLGFFDGYSAALSGDATAIVGLLPKIIAFIAALFVYYILTGIVIILFRMFRH